MNSLQFAKKCATVSDMFSNLLKKYGTIKNIDVEYESKKSNDEYFIKILKDTVKYYDDYSVIEKLLSEESSLKNLPKDLIITPGLAEYRSYEHGTNLLIIGILNGCNLSELEPLMTPVSIEQIEVGGYNALSYAYKYADECDYTKEDIEKYFLNETTIAQPNIFNRLPIEYWNGE